MCFVVCPRYGISPLPPHAEYLSRNLTSFVCLFVCFKMSNILAFSSSSSYFLIDVATASLNTWEYLLVRYALHRTIRLGCLWCKRTQGTNLAVSHCNIPTNITVTSQFCPTLPKPNAPLFCRGDPVMYLVQVLSHLLNLVCFQAPRGNLCPHYHFLEIHIMWKVSNTFITPAVLTGGTRLCLCCVIYKK